MNNIIKAQNGKTRCDDVNVNIRVPLFYWQKINTFPGLNMTLQQFSRICLEPANV